VWNLPPHISTSHGETNARKSSQLLIVLGSRALPNDLDQRSSAVSDVVDAVEDSSLGKTILNGILGGGVSAAAGFGANQILNHTRWGKY
jgi:hypothetical protein